MKILTLNKKQEKQLVKLCEEFFPDFYWENVYEGDGVDNMAYFDSGNSSVILEVNISKNRYKLLEVHWYQLCLTELSKRIWGKIPEYKSELFWDGTLEDFQSRILLPNTHPVNFLSDFVKEGKKNKYFKNEY